MQPEQDHGHHMKWMWYGMGIMFVLIGVAVIFGIFYRAPAGTAYYSYDFGWGWNILGILFFIWMLSWVFCWRWGWRGRGYRYRRWYRDDDAYNILRQRYAKGEITKEQFDQMTRDLQQHEN